MEDFKSTAYFEYIYTNRADRKQIKKEWIIETIKSPDFEEIQKDRRIRRWKYIAEAKKFLRVILLEDGETVHNVFFDRSFKRRKQRRKQ